MRDIELPIFKPSQEDIYSGEVAGLGSYFLLTHGLRRGLSSFAPPGLSRQPSDQVQGFAVLLAEASVSTSDMAPFLAAVLPSLRDLVLIFSLTHGLRRGLSSFAPSGLSRQPSDQVRRVRFALRLALRGA